MSLLKKLAGQTALYGLSSMIGRALNFLLVPFYTGVLLVGEFGVFTELYAYAAFLNVVYLFGMETTYFRFANKDKLQEVEIYRRIQTFVFLLAFFISGTLILFSQSIASLLQYPDKKIYILWLALIMGIDAIVALPFARLRLQNKAGYFAFAKLVNIGLNIALNLFFLVLCKGIYNGIYFQEYSSIIKTFYHPSRDVELIFISNLIANACMIPLLWKHFSVYRLRWNFETLQPLLIYAYPLMIMGLAGMVNEVLDRILLKPLLPEGFYPGLTKEEVLGIYGGCYKLSMFMTLAIQSFRYAADPFFFSKADDKNAPELFARVMNWFVIVCLIIFLLVSLFNNEIGALVLRHKFYQQGLEVVPILLLANLFLGIYYNLSIWYKLTDKTYFGTIITLGGAVITIALNSILIPLLGYTGAALATLLCYFLMAFASYKIGHHYFPIPYSLSKIVGYIGLAVGIVYLSKWFSFDSVFFTIGLKLAFIGLFIGFVSVINKRK